MKRYLAAPVRLLEQTLQAQSFDWLAVEGLPRFAGSVVFLHRPDGKRPGSVAHGVGILCHAHDAPAADVPLERGELLGDVILCNGVENAQVARVFYAGRCGFLHLDGVERAVAFHEHVYLTLVIVAEEAQRWSRASVDEAPVDLSKCIGLEELARHGSRLEDGGVCPA